jgi:NADPH:quinone reductase-like Zn-dependent oxidoreductase
LLTKLGAKFVINSISYTFKKDLYKAIDAMGAALAYDEFGGWLLMRFLGELEVYIEPK